MTWDEVWKIVLSALGASAPFISEEIYNSFSEIETLCKIQLNDFQDFRLHPDAKRNQIDCKEAYNNTYKRTREIASKLDSLMSHLRTYLLQLDVME